MIIDGPWSQEIQGDNMNVFLQIALLATPFVLVYLFIRAIGPRSVKYRLAASFSLLGAFLVTWINLAVGIVKEPDDPANLMFFAALVIGAVIALLAKFETAGMARAMTVTTAGLVVSTLIVIARGLYDPVTELGIHAVFIAVFAVSAALFRSESRQGIASA